MAYPENPEVASSYSFQIYVLFNWFGISCMTTDNFCFYLQIRLIRTSQTGGQWYCDTPPFSIPWPCTTFMTKALTDVHKNHRDIERANMHNQGTSSHDKGLDKKLEHFKWTPNNMFFIIIFQIICL
jgi:hypothetical protein